ncbi:hypothetical protein GL325_09365 [Aeromicrobium sp. 636]|uniref:Tetracyclin repressor-like C-terminal domain-containing protein n=1 Tax=Aeromicrobium senzhongii TaxID=2663859 RepID=A0A8I0EUS0_9ACTN|nr:MULTISPECIES: hypothetical protein [Aeromicrobium]MBC9226529.1 hypothetical protein [Aeromicrobium senzhongii]MCQ3998632.1 hypothetical protein [Aeromicrobium sp. 636]
MSDASELFHRRGIHAVEERLSTAPDPRALAAFDAYVDDAVSTDGGCAFLNAAGELPSDHPAQDVVRAHKRAVRRLLADFVAQDCPDLVDTAAVSDEVFLLLEGAIAHRGIDDGDALMARARERAERLLGPR